MVNLGALFILLLVCWNNDVSLQKLIFFSIISSYSPQNNTKEYLEGIHVSGEEREEWQIAQISQFLGKLHKLSLGMIFLIKESELHF